MSNYRRLISYMYAYEGGVKGKNVGYTKLEERMGQCKIQTNVKNIYVGSRDIGVFLLTPETEICIGKIFIRGGCGEFRTTVSAEHIEDSDVRLEECYGLTLHETENSWVAYTTIWEDAVAHAAEVELADVTAEQVRKKEAESGKQASPSVLPVLVAEESKAVDGAKQAPVELPELPIERPTETPNEAVPWKTEPEMPPIPAACPEIDVPTAPVQHPEIDVPTVPMATDVITPEIITLPSDQNQAPDPEDPEVLKELEADEKVEHEAVTAWDDIERRFVKIQAFKYDNGCEVLSVKPQDIGILPRENWVYGNNSFLLHGYYNYRHLIIAKLNNPHGNPRFLLGVPGHYYSNEKYMASMFGFPHFVLATTQPQGDVRFGYWYTDIRL